MTPLCLLKRHFSKCSSFCAIQRISLLPASIHPGSHQHRKMSCNSKQGNLSEDPHNLQYWQLRWDDSQIGWHRGEINPHLLDNIGVVTGKQHTSAPVTDLAQFKVNSEKTWYLPLCGKSLDIPYLLSQGFRVFGVELARSAIDALEQEHSLSFVYNEETKVFTGANGFLQIYMGDLFTCPVENFGPFDYVWDRGSLSAVEFSSRLEYSKMMQRALKKRDGSWHDFKYLLEVALYDKSKFEGPPRCTDDKDLEQLFGSWTNLQFLQSYAVPEDNALWKQVGSDVFTRNYLLTPKHSQKQM